MKRLLLLLLTLLMILSSFVACGPETPDDTKENPYDSTTDTLGDETDPYDSTTDPSDSTTDIGGDETDQSTGTTAPETTEGPAVYVPEPDFDTLETITFKLESGKANYSVIRPEDAVSVSKEVRKSGDISAIFADYIGKSLNLGTDSSRNNDSSTLEILVGLTDYDETAAVLDEIKYGQYIVKAVGNKIVIMGYTPDAIERAANEFIALCRSKRDKATKTVTFTAEELYCKGSANVGLNTLPTLGGKTRAYYYDAGLRTTGSGCDMMLITDTNANGYTEYTSKMEAAGYTQYTSTVMGKNKFSTYTKDRYVVTIGYFPNDKSIRVTLENGAPLAGLESENKYTKIASSQLSLLGQAAIPDTKGGNNGLSELIRLEDGRFIVIDGGHGGAAFETAFVAEIKKQAAECGIDKPVIAAWILTHPHSDHDALFHAHAEEMKNKGITIQNVFMNSLTTQYEYDKLYAQGVRKDALTHQGSIALWMDTAAAVGATMHKVHTGQVFYFANAKIEVLYTLETRLPEPVESVNATSLVMKFTFTDSETGEKTTFLSTGDATATTFECITENFGDYIASDILSLAHHGGGVSGNARYAIAAYKNVKPTLALWPIGGVRWAYVGQTDVRDALCETENLKEVYVAGSIGDVTIVPLPYKVGTVTGPYEWDIVTKDLKK